MQEYGIEIFCPEEYSEKSEQTDYGELIKTTYYSTTCEKDRNVNILLPAGYTEEKEYPVLYILHGIFETQDSMTFNSVTIGNMIAKGAAKEMIVVYPYMYASKTRDACTAIDRENVDALYERQLFRSRRQGKYCYYRIFYGRQGIACHWPAKTELIWVCGSHCAGSGPCAGKRLGNGARRAV